MPSSHDHQQPVAPVRPDLQISDGQVRVANPDVGVAFLDGPDHLRTDGVHEVDLDLIVARDELREVFRQELHDRRNIGVHPYMAFRPSAYSFVSRSDPRLLNAGCSDGLAVGSAADRAHLAHRHAGVAQ